MNIYNCHPYANCVNTIGSYECQCKIGYYGNGITCSPCPAKFYSFNETTCLPCPENSTSLTASPSIYSCKCSFPNHYPDDQTSTCISCSFGYLLDNTSNTCQSFFHFLFYFIYLFIYFLIFDPRNKFSPINKSK